MQLHWERSSNSAGDCSITYLSWMGKVPDEIPEEDGWKLSRANYYQEGWLATANLRGVVGVTYTTSFCGNMNSAQQQSANSGTTGSNNQNNNTSSNSSNTTDGGNIDVPARTNYNLRGHRSEVTLVKWNEPYQKLASCDSTGIIFVWIKYEGRWSIELINDRNTPVNSFNWSHDGRMALICYQDGFVLVGSVAGQRYWSTMLPNDVKAITGIWGPDDKHVYIATSQGGIAVLDIHGNHIAKVDLAESCGFDLKDVMITGLAWNCEKFNMEEREEAGIEARNRFRSTTPRTAPQPSVGSRPQDMAFFNRPANERLAIAFDNGEIRVHRDCFDVSPAAISTGFTKMLHMEWSNSGEFLAVAGHMREAGEDASTAGGHVHEFGKASHNATPQAHDSGSEMLDVYNTDAKEGGSQQEGNLAPVRFFNKVKFFRINGTPISSIDVPYYKSPVTALTWGHNDKRLFVATGPQVHIGWINKRIGSLQLLCRLKIYQILGSADDVEELPLPCRIKNLIASLYTNSIKCHIPDRNSLKRFVIRPPPNGKRHYCTMIRHGDELTGSSYTIYLEHLGGFLPILKGRKKSTIRPEFVIYNPCRENHYRRRLMTAGQDGGSDSGTEAALGDGVGFDSSDSDTEDPEDGHHSQRRQQRTNEPGSLTSSPRVSRKQKRRRHRNPQPLHYFGYLGNEEVDYINDLPESSKLVDISSNIWGTKFKIIGADPALPGLLGQVTYKASLLHLQPRQMRLILTELRDDWMFCEGYHPSYYVNNNSEEEDDTDKLRMDEDMLTAVTDATVTQLASQLYHSLEQPAADQQGGSEVNSPPVVAPLPSISSHHRQQLSVVDFSRLQPPTSNLRHADSDHVIPPEVSITSPGGSNKTARHLKQCTSSKHQTPSNSNKSWDQSLNTNPDSLVKNILARKLSTSKSADGSLEPNNSPPSIGSSGLLKLRRDSSVVCSSSLSVGTPASAAGDVTSCGSDSCSAVSANGAAASTNACSTVSPSRWAAKANELHETETEEEGDTLTPIPRMTGSEENNKLRRPISSTCPRSCSADHLGAIVDILGVPPDAPMVPSDKPRLILAQERRMKKKKRSLSQCGKSRSLDTDDSELTSVQSRALIDNCTRNGSKCKNCVEADVSKDLILNREIFHVASASRTTEDESGGCSSRDDGLDDDDGDGEEADEEEAEDTLDDSAPLLSRRNRRKLFKEKSVSGEEVTVVGSSSSAAGPEGGNMTPRTMRKFDAVRQLLERAKARLGGGGGGGKSQTAAAADLTLSGSGSSGNNTSSSGRSSSSGSGSGRDSGQPAGRNKSKKTALERRKLNRREELGSEPGSPVHLPRRLRENLRVPDAAPVSHSSPNTPLMARKMKSRRNQSFSPVRSILNSPLLRRKKASLDSSEEEISELHQRLHDRPSRHFQSGYQNLETFQKQKLRQKLRQMSSMEGVGGGSKLLGSDARLTPDTWSPESSPKMSPRGHRVSPRGCKELVMHNKAPLWNESSQVYQLDFGGRVTQESAKNFQIEYMGNQVMQFGRIDTNAYTLDFQYPFTAVQAFSVALANVTQRLK